MLSALNHLANEKPRKRKKLLKCREYLLALNSIFEEGLLSNGKVSSRVDRTCLKVRSGYKVLCGWAKERINAGAQIRNPKNKCFLAWQVRL